VTAPIHPTAIIDPDAELGAGVEIGPFAIVGEKVRLGDRVRVGHHASVLGPTIVGAGTHVFPFASIGSPPQDLTFKGEPTRLEIGERNVFREFVTINRGTVKGGGVTRIGSDCFFMAYAHVAHDSTIGSHVIMANCAALAGHIRIDDHAILGGLVAVHQWARVGRMAMIGGVSGVALDVPPFCIASGERAKLYGLNLVQGVFSQTLVALASLRPKRAPMNRARGRGGALTGRSSSRTLISSSRAAKRRATPRRGR